MKRLKFIPSHTGIMDFYRSVTHLLPYHIRKYFDYAERLVRGRKNIVKLKKIKWYEYKDTDTMMLHANFELLRMFIENGALEISDYGEDIEKEFMELYEWWEKYPYEWKDSERYKTKWAKYEKLIVSRLGNVKTIGRMNKQIRDYVMEEFDWEINTNKTENDNLIRLVKLRDYLWF